MLSRTIFLLFSAAYAVLGTPLYVASQLPGPPSAISPSGMITGSYGAGGYVSHYATLLQQFNLPGYSMTLSGVNDAGLVSGTLFNGVSPQAFLFDGSNFLFAGSGPGGSSSIGGGINNAGVMTGTLTSGGAFRFDTGGSFTQSLLMFQGLDINESGAVSGLTNAGVSAVWLADGTIQGVPASGAPMTGISNAGHTVGTDGSQTGYFCAPGAPSCTAFAGLQLNKVNSSGYAVGSRFSDSRAIVVVNGVALDLNTLIVNSSGTLENALDINDAGEIVAYGQGGVGYLLTPVPEPASLGLAGAGLALAVWIRRRRGAHAG